MHALVRPYIVSRGMRVALVVLLGTLLMVAAGALLPLNPVWRLVRLLVLLGGLLLAFRTLQAPTLAFFLTTLGALWLFHLPLETYVAKLHGQASGLTVFMIVLFGGTLALVSRQELLNALPRDPEAIRRSPEYTRVAREAAVLCLLRRWDDWMQRAVTSPWLRGALLLPLVLINCVSSGPAVLFFKSLWVPSEVNFRTRDADRALAAGILCLCTSWVLLVYLGAERLRSPWWLFFTNAVKNYPTIHLPAWPVAVYCYGLLSFVHGAWLIVRRARPTVPRDQRLTEDLALQRLQGLYLVLLLACLLAVGGAFAWIAWWGHGQQGAHAPVETSIVVSAVFVALLLALLLAQGIMYRLFMRPAEDVWQPETFWSLMLQGMQDVFSTVVTLVVILAFNDVLTLILKPLEASSIVPQQLLTRGWGQSAILAMIFVLTWSIGCLIGTAWGTFTLGVLLLRISGLQLQSVATVVEALILVATWINQSSLNANNVQLMLGPEHCSRETVRAVWAVPTFPRLPQLQAQYVQYGILVVSIALAVVVRWGR